MTKSAITVRGVFLGGRIPSDVVIRNGTVVEVTCADGGRPDIGSSGCIIAPTLFDIQVNGYGGVNLHGPDLRPEEVRAITDMLAKQGVSHWIPTLVTGSQKALVRGCEVLAEAMTDRTVARAVPGIHLEGPYISPIDGPRGAHPRKHVRKPNLREFDQCLKAAKGKIVYVTVAPEVGGAVPFIRALVRRGIVVALGHHFGDAQAIANAVDAGARLCTHLGNGMKPEIPRHANPLWPQLAEDRLCASLIPDLEHLPEPVLKTFIRTKTPERTILTSDVVYLAGLKPGKYEFNDAEVELLPSGRICLSGTSLLAGSSLGLLQGVLNAAHATDLNLEQAFACATSVPARLLGIRHRFQLPKVGRKANFVAFETTNTRNRPRADVKAVFINGSRRI